MGAHIQEHLEEQRTRRYFSLTLILAVLAITIVALCLLNAQVGAKASTDATREVASIAIAALLGALGGTAVR
jgi:hypothetical protein